MALGVLGAVVVVVVEGVARVVDVVVGEDVDGVVAAPAPAFAALAAAAAARAAGDHASFWSTVKC